MSTTDTAQSDTDSTQPDTGSTSVGSGASFSHLATRMGDEGTFQLVEDARPLRVGGFIALLAGILSGLAYFGIPLWVIPGLGVAFGLAAVRSYEGPKPVGYNAGLIGLFLSLALGTVGVTVWVSHRNQIARHAEHYAKAYLNTVAMDYPEAVMQLRLPPGSRTEAPLRPFYASDPERAQAVVNAHNDPTLGDLYKIGHSLDWKTSRPTRIDQGFHDQENVEVVLVDPSGEFRKEMQVQMQFYRSRDGKLKWYVTNCQAYRELIVAKSNY